MRTESTAESRFVSESHPAEGGCRDRAAPFGSSCCPERSAALDSRNCSPPLAARGAAFLDRDGVINDQTSFVNTPDDFNLLPGVAAAIRRLNEAKIPVIVITNQGGIALGYLTEDDLAAIHQRMAELLAAEGAHIDKVYYCPYLPKAAGTGKEPTSALAGAPKEHQPGTVPRYAKDSPDRKPGIGMLERARDDLGIDLRTSFLVGDATSDVLAGLRAGCTTILVRTGYAGTDGKEDVKPNHTVDDLAAAVDLIVSALID